jgi:hypothetical protein
VEEKGRKREDKERKGKIDRRQWKKREKAVEKER